MNFAKKLIVHRQAPVDKKAAMQNINKYPKFMPQKDNNLIH